MITRRYLYRLSAISLATILLTMLARCNLGGFIEDPPTPAPTSTPPYLSPAKTIVFCDDETPSYPINYFQDAAAKVADWIDQLVQPAQLGGKVYVQYIKGNSFAEDALVDSFDLPRVGPEPVQPTPIPTPVVGDVYGSETATVGTRRGADEYKKASDKFAQELQAAHDAVNPHTRALRTMVDHQVGPSDIWGCPQSATDRFAHSPAGPKYLVIASDMERVGPQERVDVDLTGVKVAIIFYRCDDAFSCREKSDYWTTQLTSAHANSVTFLREDEARVLQQLFT